MRAKRSNPEPLTERSEMIYVVSMIESRRATLAAFFAHSPLRRSRLRVVRVKDRPRPPSNIVRGKD